MFLHGSKWYCTVRDFAGKRVNVPLSKQKPAARAWKAKLEHALAEVRAGMPVKIEVVPLAVRDRFIRMLEEVGHPLASQRHGNTHISTHVEDFHGWHLARASASHAKTTRSYIERILAEARVVRLSQIHPDTISLALTALLTGEGARSHRTHNAALTALRTFVRWCLRTGRIDRDPLVGLDRLNEKADRRRVRRALSEEEVSRLLEVAPGERSLLYDFAIRTGLRRGELERIRWCDIFDTSIRVTHESGKAHREDWVAVDPAMLNALAAFRKPTWTGVVFGPAQFDHLTEDLFDAKIARANDDGIIDWHSLRHTCGTILARRGESLLKVQRHMRHSSPVMTEKYYIHLRLEDQSSVAAAFGDLRHGNAKDSPAGVRFN